MIWITPLCSGSHIYDFENAGTRLSKDGERVIPVYVGWQDVHTREERSAQGRPGPSPLAGPVPARLY